MRQINMVARDRLNAELRRNPPHAAATLAERLGVSPPTLLRMVRERPDDIFRLGSTKNARYALRRSLRGKAAPIPVFRIDTLGRGHEAGTLELAAPSGTVLDLRAWGWLRIPAKLDSNSIASWTRIPEEAGQSERSDAGFSVFTLLMSSGSSFRVAT